MMTLADASRFFDDQTFTDTNGTATFAGQILPFTDSVRSGASTKRRILDVDSDVTIPIGNTITEASGRVYIVASVNEDYFQGDVIRAKYAIAPVSDTYAIRTIGQTLGSAGGTTGVYALPSYIRRVIFEEQSGYSGGFEIYMSPYYSAVQNMILYGNGRYYRTREKSRIDDVGFTVVEAVEIDDPISTVTVQQKGTVMDPATDDYVAAAPITGVSVFMEHIEVNYLHEALGFVRLEAGDRAISFLKSVVTTIDVGEMVGDYLVKAVSDEDTAWTVHGRKV